MKPYVLHMHRWLHCMKATILNYRCVSYLMITYHTNFMYTKLLDLLKDKFLTNCFQFVLILPSFG